MKKVFIIFSMAGCLSLVNGINNANALSNNPVITLSYTCPEGCTLQFVDTANGIIASCVKTYMDLDDPTYELNGIIIPCADPTITFGTTNATVNLNDYDIISIPENMSLIDSKKVKKQTKPVSARSAETPKMVKKIVYEQVMEE